MSRTPDRSLSPSTLGATKELRLLVEFQEDRLEAARALLLRARDAMKEVRAGRLDAFTSSAIAEIHDQIDRYLDEADP